MEMETPAKNKQFEQLQKEINAVEDNILLIEDLNIRVGNLNVRIEGYREQERKKSRHKNEDRII